MHCQLTDQRDEFKWRFSPDGKYSTRSAYNMQFQGAFADFEWDHVWKLKTEEKCRFFSWLFLQNKLWTADRIIKHGGQVNSICQLCYAHLETALHLIAQCAYSRSIWQLLADWSGLQIRPQPNGRYRRLKTWWRNMTLQGSQGRGDQQGRLQKFVYTIWNIWKEGCHRTYDQKALPVDRLASIIKFDVQQWRLAWGRAVALDRS
jgi:hypothetical protein